MTLSESQESLRQAATLRAELENLQRRQLEINDQLSKLPTGVWVGKTYPASDLHPLTVVFQKAVAEMKVGDVAELPVAICKTDRVVYDGVDRIVMLNCKKFRRLHDNIETIAVICPKCPGGLSPGVSVGLPLIAASDMRPYKPARRSFRRY